MAYGLNSVELIGNLGADPELRETQSGTAVANLRLATNESYKDDDGELVEKVEWHRLVAWGYRAETLAKYLHKGSKLYVRGKLQTSSYEDNDGNTRYSTEVVVQDFIFLDSKRDNDDAPAPKKNGKGGARKNGRKAKSVSDNDELPWE